MASTTSGLYQLRSGWLSKKVVQVVLLARGVPGPGAAPKGGQPVVGRGAVGFWVYPDIPVSLRVISTFRGFLKTRGAGLKYGFHHLTQMSTFRSRSWAARRISLKSSRVPKMGSTRSIIRNVVPKVLHGRLEKGRKSTPHLPPGWLHSPACAEYRANRRCRRRCLSAKLRGVNLVDDGTAPTSRFGVA